MAVFDKQKFADYLDNNISALPFGEGACAKHVRLGLAAGGLKPVTWPVAAKDWGGALLALGFTQTPSVAYLPQLGDVVVIQATSKDQYGHIEGYDGTQWVSDFKQREFWPGPAFRAETPAYAIYRYNS